jgi:hypothetical protein
MTNVIYRAHSNLGFRGDGNDATVSHTVSNQSIFADPYGHEEQENFTKWCAVHIKVNHVQSNVL